MRYAYDPMYQVYNPVAAHMLDAETADFGHRGEGLPAVESRYVNGCPPCAYCGNDSAGSCGNCGTVFCGSARKPDGKTICPGCGATLSINTDPNGGGFKIKASQG